jgi:hypothetical protein
VQYFFEGVLKLSTIEAVYLITPGGTTLASYAELALFIGQGANAQTAQNQEAANAAVNATPVSLYSPTAYYLGLKDGLVAFEPATTSEPNIEPESYRELAEMLSQLSSSGEDDDWHIEQDVYNTSVQVAAALFNENIPAPNVFFHGPKSVVFNWDDGETNLYLTVGRSRLWAAVSSASEVKTRLELTGPANNVTGDFLMGLQQSFTKRPLLAYAPHSNAS